MEFAEELRASLQSFLVSGTIEIRESGGRIEVIRVGLAESWRRGLRVVLRQ